MADCGCRTHPGMSHDEYMWQSDHRRYTQDAEARLAGVQPTIDRVNAGQSITWGEVHNLRWAAHALNWMAYDLHVRHPDRDFKFLQLYLPEFRGLPAEQQPTLWEVSA